MWFVLTPFLRIMTANACLLPSLCNCPCTNISLHHWWFIEYTRWQLAESHIYIVKIKPKNSSGIKEVEEKCEAVLVSHEKKTLYNYCYLLKKFKWDRTSIREESKNERYEKIRTKENIQKVEELVIKDRRIKVSVISNVRSIRGLDWMHSGSSPKSKDASIYRQVKAGYFLR